MLAIVDPDRFLLATDGGRDRRASPATIPFAMTVPGGATVDVAGRDVGVGQPDAPPARACCAR